MPETCFLPLINDNLKAKELLARVENSLAEKLTYGPNANRKLALELFENSIEIKKVFMTGRDWPVLMAVWEGS